jgi:hypothetical protein
MMPKPANSCCRSIPLAALADNDTDKLDELRRLMTASDGDGRCTANLWRGIGEAAERVPKPPASRNPPPEARSQWYVLIECQDEANQLELPAPLLGPRG